MNTKTLKSTKYDFDASAKTITFVDEIEHRSIVLIINSTRDNVTIYNFACSGVAGNLSNKVLSLDYDTTSMQDSDNLIVIIEEEISSETKELEKIRLNNEILSEILEQMKVNNTYLSLITGQEINQTDY